MRHFSLLDLVAYRIRCCLVQAVANSGIQHIPLQKVACDLGNKKKDREALRLWVCILERSQSVPYDLSTIKDCSLRLEIKLEYSVTS